MVRLYSLAVWQAITSDPFVTKSAHTIFNSIFFQNKLRSKPDPMPTVTPFMPPYEFDHAAIGSMNVDITAMQ